MSERKNTKANQATETAKKAAAKKTATRKQTAKKAEETKPSFAEFATEQAKQREALAQKISETDKSAADFDAIQRAATQHNYYTFAGKVADVLQHAKNPEQAKRNNYGKMTALCFILHGLSVNDALKKAKHQANTTRQANGQTYNPQLSNFEKAIRFCLENFDKKAITVDKLQKHIDNKTATQSREFLKSLAFIGLGNWIGRGGILETDTADTKKLNTLKAAFNIK